MSLPPDWTSPIASTYDAASPDASFAALARLGYEAPDHMVAAAESLAPSLSATPTILDVGCGYGTFGAVLRHYGSAAALFAASTAGMFAAAAAGMFAASAAAKAGTPRQPPRRATPLAGARIVGLDVAAPAVRFAEAHEFVDHGITEDLAGGPPSPGAAAALATADLVVEAGIEWTALGALMPNLLPLLQRRPPILLGPRGDAPTLPVFAALAAAGYAGRCLTDAPLRFRRFVDADERHAALGREAQPGATAAADDAGYRMHVFLFLRA